MVAKKKPSTKSKKAKQVHKKKQSFIARILGEKEPPMQSFKLSREHLPFFTFRITRQTLYWSALLIVVLVLELWILKLQLDVLHVTDSLSAQ